VSKAGKVISPASKYLEIPLGGEGLLAHIALEGLVARVGAHVDLESGTRAEVPAADVAEVLVIHRGIQTRGRRSCGHQSLLKVEGTGRKAMGI